jgi:4-hydroxyphenylacetate 3-monooxygenase oxygenase component
MALRTGQRYRESLRDDREIWIDGERVQDVTTDPRLRGAVESVAELYDLQHRDDLRERLAYHDEELDEPVGLSYLEPRSADDLVRRRAMVKTWMDWTGGMMGRSPDFMNIHMTGFASGHEWFAQGGEEFGRNARAYYELLKREDLCLTHVLINPQTNRSKEVHEVPQDTAAKIVRETDDGVVIRGARVISTLAPYAHEIAVFPSTNLKVAKEAEPYAFAFCIPVATPGLRFICRPGIARPGERLLDYPFSGRMDEMDCVVVFDDVLVPWERMFIHRNPELCTGGRIFNETGAMNQIMHQFAIKAQAKAEFLLGVALALTESIGVNQFPQVQNYLNEMINAVETVRACIRASEADAAPGPGGTVLPATQPLWTARTVFPQMYPRLVEIIQIVGASGLVMVPSVRELEGERAEDVMRYYQATTLPADRRTELFRVAWDVACSSFAGRQTLYERYFSGDPWRLAMVRQQVYPHRDELKARVWDFIERTRELDRAALEGRGAPAPGVELA